MLELVSDRIETPDGGGLWVTARTRRALGDRFPRAHEMLVAAMEHRGGVDVVTHCLVSDTEPRYRYSASADRPITDGPAHSGSYALYAERGYDVLDFETLR